MSNSEEILQREYIEKAKAYVSDYKTLIGHEPSARVCTFGCEMNAERKTA